MALFNQHERGNRLDVPSYREQVVGLPNMTKEVEPLTIGSGYVTRLDDGVCLRGCYLLQRLLAEDFRYFDRSSGWVTYLST